LPPLNVTGDVPADAVPEIVTLFSVVTLVVPAVTVELIATLLANVTCVVPPVTVELIVTVFVPALSAVTVVLAAMPFVAKSPVPTESFAKSLALTTNVAVPAPLERLEIAELNCGNTEVTTAPLLMPLMGLRPMPTVNLDRSVAATVNVAEPALGALFARPEMPTVVEGKIPTTVAAAGMFVPLTFMPNERLFVDGKPEIVEVAVVTMPGTETVLFGPPVTVILVPAGAVAGFRAAIDSKLACS
jgi:hypothetical protein